MTGRLQQKLENLVSNDAKDLSVSLAERIRVLDAKSPAELAKLAAEIKENMQDLSNVEPEIRQMLAHRQRAAAMQDNPSPPRTPEPVAERDVPQQTVLRQCCCGCGAMLVCASGEDASMTEMCQRQLTEPSGPPVDAAAQRAYFKQLSMPRKKPSPKHNDEPMPPTGPARPPNYGRLHAMAKPRELPPPPPPPPNFRALPAPSFARAPPCSGGLRKSSISAPDLLELGRTESYPSAPRLSLKAPRELARAGTPPDGSMIELRYHAMQNNPVAQSPASYGLPMLPGLDQGAHADPPRQNKRHVSASSQRQYTDKRLYRKPKHAPGSMADLQARLEALRTENKASWIKEQLQASRREKKKYLPPWHEDRMASSSEVAAEIF